MADKLVRWHDDLGAVVKFVDQGDGTHAPAVTTAGVLLTDDGGPNQRIRVDVGQTGFFSGKEFRTFKEFDLATGTSITVKVVVPINIILFGFVADLIAGSLRVESLVGGTEGGAFDQPLPVFARNTMSERPTPLYTPQVVLNSGGTVTGGTLLDVFLMQTAGMGSQAASVGTEVGDERGIGAGTYYIRLSASGTGNTTGVARLRWEERP